MNNGKDRAGLGVLSTLLTIGLAFLSGASWADVATCDAWRCQYSPEGAGPLEYAGKRLLTGVSVGYFQRDYKKTFFSDRGGQVSGEGNVVSVRKNDDFAESIVTITLASNCATVDLDLLIKRESGLLEYCLVVPLEDFRWPDGTLFMRTDQMVADVKKNSPFETMGIKSFAIQTPEAEYGFANKEGALFTIRDERNDLRGCVRCITCKDVKAGDRVRLSCVWTASDGYDAATVACRRKNYRRELEHLTPVLRCGGFEDGIGCWNAGLVVDDVFRSGKHSLLMNVDDPMTDNVYSMRKVPVSPGHIYRAACWVKTDGVEVAPGKMPSCGAGLIVEWLDKDAKWFEAGMYACGVWGTTDWTNPTVRQIRAPDGAGYAMLYLTVRAKGRAWFDDITFDEVFREVEKKEPAIGARIANNAPKFTWERLRWVSSYRVELSQDPQFKSGVKKYTTGEEPEFQPVEPLEQGTWYWRVSADGTPDSFAWDFVQTLPKDADCTPPQVYSTARRIVDSSADVVVEATDNVGIANVKLNGRACVRREGNRYVARPPEAGWPKGLSELELLAEDTAGNVTKSTFWLLNAPAPQNAVKISDSGFYEQGGKRIYPIGIYQVETNYMADVRQAGFDLVHYYRWEFDDNDAMCRQYLDACWNTGGLRAFVGFVRGGGGLSGIMEGNYAHVAHRIGALADHPGLFCWYLYDEPEGVDNYVAPAVLASFADLVRELDPFHPVVMTTWNQSMINYRRCWDTHWTQAYAPPAIVAERVGQHKEYLNHASPITLIVGAYDEVQSDLKSKGVTPDPEKFALDYDYMRACAFLSVTEGCNGLMWWWYANGNTKFYTVAMVPEAWGNVSKICHELKAMASVLNDPAPAMAGRIGTLPDSVSWWHKTVGDTRTLVVVNTSEREQVVEIEVPGKGLTSVSLRRYEVKVFVGPK